MKTLKLVQKRMADFNFFYICLCRDRYKSRAVLEIVSKICPQLHIEYNLRSDHPNFDFFLNDISEMILECCEENDILEISAQDLKILRLPVDFINDVAEVAKECLSFSPPKSVVKYTIDLCYPNSYEASFDINCNRSGLMTVSVAYGDAEYLAKWSNYLIGGQFNAEVTKNIIKKIEITAKGLFSIKIDN